MARKLYTRARGRLRRCVLPCPVPMVEPAPVASTLVAPQTAFRQVLSLSGPLVAGHAGNQLMGFVDVAMVGRLGDVQLAAVAMGNGIYFALTLLAGGCVFGMDALVSQAIGAGETARARRLLWQGLRLATLLGFPAMLLIGVAPLLLEPCGVDAETATQTLWFSWSRLLGVIPFLWFCATRSYLQALHRTRPIVIATILANVVNFIGNGLLIYGDVALEGIGLPGIGLPALGVVGSGLASSIASIAAVVVLARAVRRTPAPLDPTRRAPDRELQRRILIVGAPVGFHIVAEIGVFTLVGVLAGTMSPTTAASHQIALTLASFTFTVVMGIAAATSVVVGHAVGRGDTPGARAAGIAGLRISTVFMSATALVFFLAPLSLARILTDSEPVALVAAPLILVAAVFQISDGIQCIAGGALRGAGDTRVTFWAHMVSHYGIALPLSLLLAYKFGLGATGLWWGLALGLSVVAVFLTVRFFRITSRAIARV